MTRAGAHGCLIATLALTACADPPRRGHLELDHVEARFEDGFFGGLHVRVEARVAGGPLRRAPMWVMVQAHCGHSSDQWPALGMAFSDGAPEGTVRRDDVEIGGASRPTADAPCELWLVIEPEPRPRRYCFDGARTVAGGCAESQLDE